MFTKWSGTWPTRGIYGVHVHGNGRARSRMFMRGGGGGGGGRAKDYVRARTLFYERETRSPFRLVSMASLMAMEALGFLLSLVLSEPYF